MQDLVDRREKTKQKRRRTRMRGSLETTSLPECPYSLSSHQRRCNFTGTLA
jgi:hypothetical protein